MAIALVQSKIGAWKSSGPTSGTEQPNSNITTGNLLVLTVHLDSPQTVSTVTDTAGNTWVRGPNRTQGVMTASSVEIWYVVITAGGGTRPTITITNSGVSNFGCMLYEYSGIATTSPLDVSTQNGSTATTSLLTGTTGTTSQSNELVLSAAMCRSSTSSYTSTSANGNTANIVSSNFIRPTVGYKIVSATGTQSDTFTTSATASVYAAVIATFKEAGVSNPLLATLSDNFNDNSLDVAKWSSYTAGTGSVSETSQQIQINSGTANGNYNGMDSVNLYNLTASYGFVKVVASGTAVANYNAYPIQVSLDSNNQYYWALVNSAGSMVAQCWKAVAGVFTQVGSNMAHVDGTYYKLREASGTLYYDYSSDGVNWTNANSTAVGFAVTSLIVSIFTEVLGTITARTLILDDFNIAGTPATSTSNFFQMF